MARSGTWARPMNMKSPHQASGATACSGSQGAGRGTLMLRTTRSVIGGSFPSGDIVASWTSRTCAIVPVVLFGVLLKADGPLAPGIRVRRRSLWGRGRRWTRLLTGRVGPSAEPGWSTLALQGGRDLRRQVAEMLAVARLAVADIPPARAIASRAAIGIDARLIAPVTARARGIPPVEDRAFHRRHLLVVVKTDGTGVLEEDHLLH